MVGSLMRKQGGAQQDSQQDKQTVINRIIRRRPTNLISTQPLS